MASGEPNLKVNVGADTSQFTKGIKQAKADLKTFGAVSDDVLGKLAGALGIDTGQVEKMASALRGMGQQFTKAGQEGEAATAKMLSGFSKLGAGIAAIGIAGVIAGFKALNAEAENFRSTIAGANIELQTKAFIDTYKQAIHDMNAGVGEGMAKAQADWKKWLVTLPQALAARLAVAPGGTATGFAVGQPSQQQLALQKQINAEQQAAVDKAARAEQIAGRLYELDRLQSDRTRQIADLDSEIAKQRAIMRDVTYSNTERLAAYKVIVDKIAEKEALQIPIERERTALMDELVGLTASTPAAVDAANQQYVRQETLIRQLTDEKTSLLRYANTLQVTEAKTTEEMALQAALAKQIAESRKELAALNLKASALPAGPGIDYTSPGLAPNTSTSAALKGQFDALLGGNGGALYIPVSFQIDHKSVADLAREATALLAGMAESMSDAIGGLIGDLVTGGDAWGNFANAALSAFGDMATAVGKIAIQTGIASLGIKASLESLGAAGPAIAIAAGAALVALGAAVKAGLSNVANGSYSASQNVASSSWSAGNTDFETRDVNFHVTGELVADGDKLVAVINNTGKRNGYTT